MDNSLLDSDLLLFKYLSQLYIATKVESKKIEYIQDSIDTITLDTLQDHFFILDDCKNSFYNYFTLIKLFLEEKNFFNPLTRQQIQKITKVQFIKTK